MEKAVNFGESLNEILSRKEIKPKEFAKAINVSLSTVYSWLRSTTEPNLSAIITMADYFKCSIEFLIGRSDDDRTVSSRNYPPLTQNIKKVMKEVGMSSYNLRNISKYDGAYFYNWDHGSEPQLSTLVDLAGLLDCTIDYLVGRE